MAKEKETERQFYRMVFGSFACVLTAGVILLPDWISRYGGRTDVAVVSSEVQDTEENRVEDCLPEERTEDSRIIRVPDERPLKVKEMAGETDDITLGIDVSKFQETIDWEQVAASGVDFAMIRVGFRRSVAGEITEDECARCNLEEAAECGIRLGAYFFSTAVSEAEALEEADWVCEFLEGYPITYPVVYNCEGFQDETSRQYGMTAEERSALAQVFLNRVEEAGYTGMFYAARSELQDSLLWDTEALEQRYRIWVAQYLDQGYPDIDGPEYDGSFAMWQYTDQGTVPGIRTVVDLNVAYFGYEGNGEVVE